MIRFRRYQSKDLAAAAAVARGVYRRYVYPHESNHEARQKMLRHHNPSKNLDLKNNYAKADIFFLAVDNMRIIGMIKGKNNHLAQLYVRGAYQRRGIGRELVRQFETAARKLQWPSISINAAPNAVDFYKKLGYKKSTGLRRHPMGFQCQPMKKSFDKKYEPIRI